MAMLRAADVYGGGPSRPFRYYHLGRLFILQGVDEFERIGQMLWDQNGRAVRELYSSPEMQAPDLDDSHRWYPYESTPSPIEAIKVAECFAYQASSSTSYEGSEASAFTEALIEVSIKHLPGYAEAPWGWAGAIHITVGHVLALLKAADVYGREKRSTFSYHYKRESHRLQFADDFDRVGTMLWDQNSDSIRRLFSNPAVPADPIPSTDDDPDWYPSDQRTPSPVEAIKLAKGYGLQSCVVEGYRDSEVAAFVEALISTAIECVPGYDEAPWGWDERGRNLD